MKKLFSLFCIFMMCSVFCLTSFKIDSVKADDVVNVASSDIVYKMYLESNNKAIYQVHQYYRKSGLDGFMEAEKYNISKIVSDGVKVSENPLPNGGLASFYMNKNGKVVLGTANGVEIVNLRFYYIIANSTNTTPAFCKNDRADQEHDQTKTHMLCENSLTVGPNQNGFTNWKNNAVINNLSYTKSQINNEFTVTTDEVGKKTYVGYDIFENIPSSYVDIAKKSGIYVVAGMSVSFSGKEYLINEYMLDNSEFKFDLFSKAFLDDANNKITFSNFTKQGETNIYNSGKHEVTELTKLAVLVVPSGSLADDARKKESMSKITTFWEETLRPIVIFAVGILFVVVGATTGATIVKSSDEPEVRNQAIKKLIGLFIGVLVIELLLIFYPDIVEIVRSFIK